MKCVFVCVNFFSGFCVLIFIELDGYVNIIGVLIIFCVGLDFWVWWGDDFCYGWIDNSCEVVICCSSVVIYCVKCEIVEIVLC